MKKIASFVSITIAAAALATGCAVDVAEEGADVGTIDEAVCVNNEGTNLMLASLAAAMGTELHRWNIVGDFEMYIGMYNQQMLRIKSGSRYLCSNNCATIDGILSLQDPRNDQKVRFSDGTRLSSWTFAARLVAGRERQKTCEQRAVNGDPNSCSSELHYLTKLSASASSCGGDSAMFKYSAEKGTSSGGNAGGALTYPAQLQQKLIWAENGALNTNPFLLFNVLPGGLDIEIDPLWCATDTACTTDQQPGACANQLCTKMGLNLTGQCCTCVTAAGTLNGTLQKTIGGGSLHVCTP